jgi:hypothetical protein
MAEKNKKVEFEAWVRNQASGFSQYNDRYGKIISKKLGDFINQKVKVSVEIIEKKKVN